VGLALVGDRATGTATVDWVREGSYEVDLAGSRYPVAVGLRSPYDPDGRKLSRDGRP
jgi:4-methylaminobutanoate oxidase (formaldehyde-forming)